LKTLSTSTIAFPPLKLIMISALAIEYEYLLAKI